MKNPCHFGEGFSFFVRFSEKTRGSKISVLYLKFCISGLVAECNLL